LLCVDSFKAHAVCDYLNFIVKDERLLKVMSSHIHWKSVNVSETVVHIDVLTTGAVL